MRIVTGGRDQSRPAPDGMTVLWKQSLKSWDDQVVNPIVEVVIADRVLELEWREARELRRRLNEVMDKIEEARSW